jgi:chromosome segregation ATPase
VDLQSAVNVLMIELGITIPEQFKSLTSFLNDAQARARVAELKDVVAEKESEITRLSECLHQFYARLRATSFVDATHTLDHSLSQITDLRIELEAVNAALKKSKKKARHFYSLYIQENDRHESEQREIDSLSTEKKEIEKRLAEAQKEQEALKKQIMELTVLSAAKVKESHESHLVSLEEQMSKMQEQQQSAIHEKDEHLQTLRQQLAQSARLLTDAKKDILTLHSLVSEKDRELKTLASENNEQFKALQARNEMEIGRITADHKGALEQVRARIHELQTLGAKYATALEESELRNQALFQNNTELQLKIEELESQIASSRDGKLREQQLIDARIQATELSAEAQKHIALDRLRARYEEEQRKLTAFIASSFPNYVDLRRELTPDALRDTIARAAAEVTRLAKQDAAVRRLLGISLLDSCEVALARRLR